MEQERVLNVSELEPPEPMCFAQPGAISPVLYPGRKRI